jgi:hypothetical protein
VTTGGIVQTDVPESKFTSEIRAKATMAIIALSSGNSGKCHQHIRDARQSAWGIHLICPANPLRYGVFSII